MKQRIVIVVSDPMTVRSFLRHQIDALSTIYDVWLVANVASRTELGPLPAHVQVHQIHVVRPIDLLRDASALVAMFRFFRRQRFDLVHSITPKAGLLAMMAAWAARVPVRIHTFTGQVWATREGWSRRMLKTADRLIAALATDLLTDSATQRDFMVHERVVAPGRCRVLASGSISGVDVARFAPDDSVRTTVRAGLGIPSGAVVFLFLGRLHPDKGIAELVAAFRRVAERADSAYLVLVGPDEGGILSLPIVRSTQRLLSVGITDEPERYFRAADVLCLPSRREGFGTVVIEAACAEVPAIASRIYGIVDAVVDGETGILVAPGDEKALTAAMVEMIAQPERRRLLGAAARRRAESEYTQERITEALLSFYEELLTPRSERRGRN